MPEISGYETEHLILTQIFDAHSILEENVRFLCPVDSDKLFETIISSIKDFGIRHKELFRDSEAIYRQRQERYV